MSDSHAQSLRGLSIEDLRLLARIPVENPNPILRVGFDGILSYANQAFYKLKCFSDLKIGEIVSTNLKEPVDNVVTSGQSLETEIHDDNRIFLFSLTPVPDVKSVFLYGRDITVRKKIEMELSQMALIARETDNAVIITDPEGRVEWVNKGFENFTGYTLDEIRGKIPGNILQGPDTDPVAVKRIAEAIQKRVSVEQDLINYSKNGIPYWIRINIQPVFNADGELSKFISLQKNITSEKLLQQEVKESERKLRTILDSALDGVIIINDQSLVINWTRQSEIIFGFTAEEAMGRPLRTLIVPDRFAEAHMNGMRRYLSTKIPHILNQRIEIPGIRKNREEFPLELTVIPIQDKEGLIFCAFVRDISDRITAQKKIESSTSRLTALISNQNAGILVEDQNRDIALINKRFCDMFGIPVDPSVLIGTDCSQSAEQSKGMFKNPDGFVSRIDEILRRQEISINEELDLADGRVFERDYIPIFSEGVFLGNLWQYRDITFRKRNELLLELAKKSAEEANMAKSNFLANMSHEIRTPMNAVHGIVRLLTEAPHLPEQADLHNRLIASSETLLAIINDILDFSKIEAGLLSLETTPFSLQDVFTRVVSSMEIKASQKSLRLTSDIDPDAAPVLLGDPTRLAQVLLNLVSNAIKFTEKGEVIVKCLLVKAEQGTNTLCFKVIDTGIGIDESRLSKIFESYEQENTSTTRQYGGTGLGLSISRQLVDLMGGILTVDSIKNQGSTFLFTISLPVGDKSAFQGPRRKIVIDPEKLRGVRVLVVEDNEMNQFVAKSILLKWNMMVFQARNGRQAIEFLQDQDYDIILMDKQMPVMGGVEATRYIRKTMQCEIPIIALTADAVIEMVQECLDAGMNAYVTKPFEPSELYEQILRVMNME